MQKLNVPKVEVNNELAIKETIKNYISEQIDKREIGDIIDFSTFFYDIDKKFPEVRGNIKVKMQARREAIKIAASKGKIRMLPNGNYVKDKDNEGALKDETLRTKNEARKLLEKVIDEMKLKKKAITKSNILAYLDEMIGRKDVDIRIEQYRTWISILCSSGEFADIQPEKPTSMRKASEQEQELAI